MSFEMKNLLQAYKREGVLLPKVERYLATRPAWEDREIKVTHPSDLLQDSWCPRAIVLRITTGRVLNETTNIVRDSAFEDGHDYHRKWQRWAWNVGLLEGRYRCLSCGHGDWRLDKEEWFTQAPVACGNCGASKRFLEYGEVPVRDEERRISGSADGLLLDHILEVKSIGLGTVRWEEPALVSKHTHDGVIDLPGLWKDIKQPFIPHIRQVNIYGAILGIEKAVLIYDYKPGGQRPKEFVVTLNPVLAEPYLKRAELVRDALDAGTIPVCPHGGCKGCEAYGEENTEANGEDVRGGASAGPNGGVGSEDSGEAVDRDTAPTRRRNRGRRLDSDVDATRRNAVAKLLGGEAGSDLDGGGDSGEALPTRRGGLRYKK